MSPTLINDIKIVNGFEMSLAKQYLKIDLFLSNNRIVVFLDQKWRTFELLEAAISSASGQTHFD